MPIQLKYHYLLTNFKDFFKIDDDKRNEFFINNPNLNEAKLQLRRKQSTAYFYGLRELYLLLFILLVLFGL